MSTSVKVEIFRQASLPELYVSPVMRHDLVSPNLIFKWRRDRRYEVTSIPSTSAPISPVVAPTMLAGNSRAAKLIAPVITSKCGR